MTAKPAPDDAPMAARLLADAFADDPVLAFLFRHVDRQAARRLALFTFMVEDAARRGSLDEGDGAAAVWRLLPPDPALPTHAPEDWIFAGCEPEIVATRQALATAHPETPHWYLFFLGTAVGRQGTGLGTRLLLSGLARADRMALPCYLEATTAASARLYERHGFERRGTLTIDGGPTLYPMWRPARGAGA